MTTSHDPVIPAGDHPAIPASVLLSRAAVEALFSATLQQSEYIIGLHRLVYGPLWDQISYLDGHVRCSEEVSKFIFRLAIAWDRAHQPTDGQLPFMAGGAWMNYGFSSLGMPATGWEVIPAPVTWTTPLT